MAKSKESGLQSLDINSTASPQAEEKSKSTVSHIAIQAMQRTPLEEQAIASLGLRIGKDGFLKWMLNSQDHPRNWSARRKSFDTILLFMFDLFTLVPSFHSP